MTNIYTQEELQNILVALKTVEIKGDQALTLANLQIKTLKMIEVLANQANKQKEEAQTPVKLPTPKKK